MRTLGIDLGTTNTVAAIDGTTMRLSVSPGSPILPSTILPSVVAFPPSGGPLVGAPARQRRAIDPKNTIYSAKRLMGQRWVSYAAMQFRKHYPFELVQTHDGSCAFRTRAGLWTPPAIATKLIETLFAAQQVPSTSLDAVAIAVPAGFD